jgi:hypothetical protein
LRQTPQHRQRPEHHKLLQCDSSNNIPLGLILEDLTFLDKNKRKSNPILEENFLTVINTG